MKLYKYRPLSEFLYKELYYQELYFASYFELNDPLDLSARLEFTVKEENQIEILLWFIFKTTLKLEESDASRLNNNKLLINFNNNENARAVLKNKLFSKLSELSLTCNFISVENLEALLSSLREDIPFEVDILALKTELKRLTKKFLENSYATCFSEKNDDLLMWSHYASKHSGICLEFTAKNSGFFPFKMTMKRQSNEEKYLQSISRWQIDETIFWERVKKVTYQEEPPRINFFDFFPVFDNEHDCDLIGLSKPWTHYFAYELEKVFSVKTAQWKYENEWRSISINFGDVKDPEDRIYHYPIECLSSIYFGLRTPEDAKKRIYKIFKKFYNHQINYFTCIDALSDKLEFEDWEYCDE